MTKDEILNGLKEVLSLVKPKLPQDRITMESSLITDLGIDSLAMLLMSLAIENKFNFQFNTKEPFQTVAEVVDYIHEAVS